MTDVNDWKEVTQAGRLELGKLITQARDRTGQTNWDDFADVLSEQSQYQIKKDLIWKISEGNYSRSPSITVVYALLNLPEFTFQDSDRRLTLGDVMGILTGQIDCRGNPLEAGDRHPSQGVD